MFPNKEVMSSILGVQVASDSSLGEQFLAREEKETRERERMKQLTLEISERQEQVTYSALIGPRDQHSSLIGPHDQYSSLIGPRDQYSPLIGPRDKYSPLIGAGGAERGSPAAAEGHPRLCHQIQTQQGREAGLVTL